MIQLFCMSVSGVTFHAVFMDLRRVKVLTTFEHKSTVQWEMHAYVC